MYTISSGDKRGEEESLGRTGSQALSTIYSSYHFHGESRRKKTEFLITLAAWWCCSKAWSTANWMESCTTLRLSWRMVLRWAVSKVWIPKGRKNVHCPEWAWPLQSCCSCASSLLPTNNYFFRWHTPTRYKITQFPLTNERQPRKTKVNNDIWGWEVYSDRESNQPLFRAQDDAQLTELHQPGLTLFLKKPVWGPV